jgi:thiosulfate/3-mercaptopyruvate sulfurtransferase
MRRLLLALACAVGLARTATAQARPLPQLLSTDSLAAWLARGTPVRVLDVRLDVWSYLKGHLPEAQYLNVETLRASRGGVPVQLLDAPAYRAVFQRLGLEPTVPVVVYSAGETLNIDATWVTWLLTAMGHPRVYLLDGGYYKWSFEHRAMARRYPRVAPGGSWWNRRAFTPDTASLAEVRQVVERGGAVLVDARPPDQFAGEEGTQMRRGHIPGALSHWWQDDLETSGFGRVFKPVEALRASYATQGITPDRDIILYCNTSTEASHLWFVLRALLGYPRVRIYAGSWTEWAEREELPVATGPSRASP